MSPLDTVLAALRQTGRTPTLSGGRYRCLCPAHDDHKPSLSIGVGPGSRVLLKCHAKCSAEEITAALGLKMSDLFVREDGHRASRRERAAPPAPDPKPATAPKLGKAHATADDAIAHYPGGLQCEPSKRWDYHNAEGERVGVVARWDREGSGKTYRPVSLIDGAWHCTGMPGPRPLYQLPQVAREETVYVVEGEKCADIAWACGLPATTSAHGAKSAKETDWSPLAGKHVVILPDNHEAGMNYAETVAGLCHEAGVASVRIVKLADHWPDIPEGGDIEQALELAGKDAEATRRAIEALADGAAWFKTPGTIDNSIRPLREGGNRIAFRIVTIGELGPAEEPDWLWDGYLARASITLLTGLWKAGKTTLIKYLVRDLTRGNGLASAPIDAPILLLSEESNSLWAERRETLGLDDSVHFLKRETHARPRQTEWEALIEQVAAEVERREFGLVIIDTLPHIWPVVNENDAGETVEALMPLRDIADANAALLLTHHPRKGDGAQGTATRGSGALTGFVDTIVELRRHDPQNNADTRRVLSAYGRFDSTPHELVIDLGPEGYTVLGEPVNVRGVDTQESIIDLLSESEDGLTADEVREAWPSEPLPGKTSLSKVLSDGAAEGKWERLGKGVKGNPYKYRRLEASQDSIRSGLSLKGRNDSDTDTDSASRPTIDQG